MNVFVLNLDNYNPNEFYFLEPKNNLIMDGIFTKMIYTSKHFTMNGVYFHFPIHYSIIEQHNSSKCFLYFEDDVEQNKHLIEVIRKLETQILLHYANFTNKRKQSNFNLYNQLLAKRLRINDVSSSKTKQILLNISGIWENEISFGITFKWVEGDRISLF
jgi:hypothetical protein